MGKDSKAHLADAKALLDSRGLYEGQTFHGVNPLLLVEKIIRFVRPIFQQQN
jgi:pre-mRNA-splicing factor 38A